MQCNCGGRTYKRCEVSRNIELHYVECWACGRCGKWRLVEDGETQVRGIEAQSRFFEIPTSGGRFNVNPSSGEAD